jgi:hypothetical protein
MSKDSCLLDVLLSFLVNDWFLLNEEFASIICGKLYHFLSKNSNIVLILANLDLYCVETLKIRSGFASWHPCFEVTILKYTTPSNFYNSPFFMLANTFVCCDD